NADASHRLWVGGDARRTCASLAATLLSDPQIQNSPTRCSPHPRPLPAVRCANGEEGSAGVLPQRARSIHVDGTRENLPPHVNALARTRHQPVGLYARTLHEVTHASIDRLP